MIGHVTPGEWVVSPPLDGKFTLGGDSCEIVALDSDGMVLRGICTCLLETDSHPDGKEWLEDAANARLLAASKDLLGACRTVLVRIDQLQEQWGKEAFTERTAEVLRAAISKATGGEF